MFLMAPSAKLPKWFHSAEQSAARALDKNHNYTTSPPQPLVKIQNILAELFLIMPWSKAAQMVPLHSSKGPPELYIGNVPKRQPFPS